MSDSKRTTLSIVILIGLILLGVMQISAGHTGEGAGIICGSLAVTGVRWIKNRRVREQIAQGLNPYDERVYFIVGKAAYAAYIIVVCGLALFVLAGSALGPAIMVNPYSFAGLVLAAVTFAYAGSYYYYNRRC